MSPIIGGMTDDPTAWLGDPVGIIATGEGSIVVSAPPSRRDLVVVSLMDAPQLDTRRPVDSHVSLSLDSARGLLDALRAAVSQVEEHAE